MTRKFLTIISCITLATFITSCSSPTPQELPPATTKSIFPVVSPMDFRIAVLNHTITQGSLDDEVSVISLTNTKNLYSRNSKSQASFSLFLKKTSDSDKWKPVFASVYKGNAWLFHNTAEITSSTGEFTLSGLDKGREDKVQNSGGVSEFGLGNATDVEVERYCSVISGSKVKLHIWNLGGTIRGAEYNISPSNLKFLRLTCDIYGGLTQGIVIEDYANDFER